MDEELNFKLAASATCLSSSSSSATRRRTAERKSRSGKKPYDRKISLKRGYHVCRKISGTRLYHHGICVSKTQIISFYNDSKVQRESVEEFLQGEQIKIVDETKSSKSEEQREITARRAEQYKSNQNFGTFNLGFNNCECFAYKCVDGQAQSKQTNMVLRSAVAGAVSGYAETRSFCGLVIGAIYGVMKQLTD